MSRPRNTALMRIRRATNKSALTLITMSCFIFTAALWGVMNQTARAITPPDNCFAFSAGVITDYYDNENDDSEQPACPDDVDVPSMIGGVTVTTIGLNSFANSGITAIRLPSTITDIQYQAFDGLTLSEVYINVDGNLTINGGFSSTNISSSNFNISADGDLFIGSSLSGINITGTMALSAGGDLTITNGSANGLSVGNLDIDAGGDVTVTNFSLSGSNLGSVVNIDAAGNVLVNNGSFSGTNTGALTVDANGTITFNGGGSFSTISNGVTLNSAGDILLSSGPLSGSGIGGNLIVDSGGAIQFNFGAVGTNSLTEATITAATGISLINGSLATSPNMTNLSIATQAGLVNLSGVLNGSNILENLSITAPEGLLVDNSAFSGLSSAVDLNLGGDVTIKNGTLSGADLDSFDIITDGSIMIEPGAFGGASIKHINWQAGNDLTLSSGLMATVPTDRDTEDITLHAGNALVIGDGVFSETYALESLNLQAGSSAVIGGSTFRKNKLTSLSLPSSTVSVGNNAFAYGTIDSVYLNGGTPTLGQGVFKFSGLSSDPTTGYDDIDQVHYVQLYTDVDSLNPGGYTDTVYDPEDINFDEVFYPAGGYIVNPATYTINYRSNSDNILASSLTSGTGPTLSDYLFSSNPTSDFTLYYRAGNVISLTAPDIENYITPASYNMRLANGQNTYNFVYNPIVTPSDNTNIPGAPNTSYLGKITGLIIGTIASAICLIVVVIAGKRLLAKYY